MINPSGEAIMEFIVKEKIGKDDCQFFDDGGLLVTRHRQESYRRGAGKKDSVFKQENMDDRIRSAVVNYGKEGRQQ